MRVFIRCFLPSYRLLIGLVGWWAARANGPLLLLFASLQGRPNYDYKQPQGVPRKTPQRSVTDCHRPPPFPPPAGGAICRGAEPAGRDRTSSGGGRPPGGDRLRRDKRHRPLLAAARAPPTPVAAWGSPTRILCGAPLLRLPPSPWPGARTETGGGRPQSGSPHRMLVGLVCFLPCLFWTPLI